MNKVYLSVVVVLEGIVCDGQIFVVGGFGLCGIFEVLIVVLCDLVVKGIICISNNVGVDGFGFGLLLEMCQIKKMILLYVGENKEFECQYLVGEFEFEFMLQGMFVEKLCVGGVGIFVFFMNIGYGIVIVEGKEMCQFGDCYYVFELLLMVDVVFVKVWKVDKFGNFIYCCIVCNFNLMCVMVGKIIVVEVEEIVENGVFDLDQVYMLGIFVQCIVLNVMFEKCIE